jgi:polyisoprenyl-teichoic acid--peptidoglycan teichoic acid transferase
VRERRSWPQRLLIAFNCVLVLVCLSSAWALSFYSAQVAGVPRVALGGVLDERSDPEEPVNVLLVGSDTTSDPADAAERSVHHADSISILRVDPASGEARLLSLPRDLWVTIPGKAGTHKINAALTYADPPGSPELLVQVIQKELDIRVHYYVSVDFAGFRQLVDQLDGVNLWFNRPTRDLGSGLFVDEPGCVAADGEMALQYTRARRYQERQDDGTWAEDPTSDIGRIARQQYFLKQAAKKAIARGARNPVELANLIGIAQRYLEIDETLRPQDVLDLVGAFDAFNPDDLEVTQPHTERYIRGGPGGDGLRLLKDESEPVFARFRDPVEGVDSDEPDPSSSTTAPDLPALDTTLPPPDRRSFTPVPPPGVAC